MLTGCATSLPKFSNALTPAELRPRVSDLVVQIQCEILAAVKERNAPGSAFAALEVDQLVASVDLTLSVVNKESINPSLGFIHPHNTVGTKFVLGLSGLYSGEQHREINLSFTLLVDKASDSLANRALCAAERPLAGDLGIAEILANGLRFIESKPAAGTSSPYLLRAVGVNAPTLAKGTPSADPPGFGSAIDFTVVYAAGGGPSWTLTHFTGVGGSNGLLNFQRTNKDSLVLGFAKVPTPTGSKPPQPGQPLVAPDPEEAVDRAARAAQNQVTRQIFNRLIIDSSGAANR